MSEIKKDGWIPIEESVPETGKYIMVSFENFTLPDIARYETDEQGNGAFYPGVEDKPYIEYGLVVNAWMPMPEPYSADSEKPKTNADMIRNMSDEELAEFLCKVKSDYQWMEHEFPSEEEHGEWEDWLQSKAE